MDNSDTKPKPQEISLSKRKRWFVFVIFCFLNSCLMIGAGIISSAVQYIREEFKVSDREYGLIGTAFNAGSLIGSFLFIGLSNKCNRKYVLLIELGLHCSALFICSVTSEFYVFLACRTISGNGIVMWFIYYMVWIDQFGIQKWKSWMVSLIALSGQLSMLWGYVLNLVTGPTKWKEGLRIEFFMIFSVFLVLLCVPSLFFTHNLFIKTEAGQEVTEKRDERLDSIFAYNQTSIVIEKKQEPHETPSKEEKKKRTATLFTPMFIIITLAKSAQFFVGVTIVFWYTDYANSSLNVTNQTLIFYSFTLVNVVANMIGTVLSGVVSTAIGGYGSKHTLLACLIFKVLGFPFGAIAPFTNSFLIYTVLLFFYNLFDVISVFLSNCLIMAYVSKEMKGAANGVFSVLANFLAFLPSTYVYGYLKKQFFATSPNIPFAIIMFYGFTSVIYMFIGVIIERRAEAKAAEPHFDTPPKEEKKNILLKDVKIVNKE